MKVNGKNINIDNIVDYINIDENIPKKRKNGLILRDSQIEILKRNQINYENYTSLSSLILEIEDKLNTEENEELECLSEELSEMNYYNYTNK